MNKKSPAYVLGFMAAICLVFGTGIAIVNYATQGLLAQNAVMHHNKVLCRAFDLPVEGNTAEAYQQAVDQHLEADNLDGRVIYRQTTPDLERVGFIFSGLGFWDRIEGVMVLSPDLETVHNLQFLDQKETPGLGARIEETWFTDQFKGLRVDWADPGRARVIVGASPDPAARNRVDAITGATQTSMALGRFLSEELDRFRDAYLVATPPPPLSSPDESDQPPPTPPN